jgi:hypothetical protein
MRSAAAAWVSLALGLAACAVSPSGSDPLERLSAALEGAYSNAQQFAEADAALRRPPAVGHPYDWIDAQHATFYRVGAPSIGRHVVYLEWRSGGPGGPISRQRLWSFRRDEAGAPRMDFFTFKDPSPFAGRGGEPGAFAALEPDELIGYGDACALVVTSVAGGFHAVIPESCSIMARSGRRMRLQALVALDDKTLSYQEEGVLEDGAVAFRVPGGPAYRFNRAL